jgi:SAM-dependent methyltransferase
MSLSVNCTLGSRSYNVARQLARQVIPKPVRHNLGLLRGEWQARRSPARAYQNRVMLPRIARWGGTVLLVGCRSYTAWEPRYLERHNTVCWTLDIDPKTARWGSPKRHVIAPIEQATSHFIAGIFDAVVLSGVFGFGVDEVAAQQAAIAACAAVLKPGGLLVLGWNSDLVSDPLALTAIEQNFISSPDARVTFRRCTHVFDFHIRHGLASPIAVPICDLVNA